MKRSGHTLIELLAVISGLAVVLGSAIALMQLMLGMNGEVRERTHTMATIGRLAEQFRRDVHESRGEPDVGKDRQSAEFELPGGGAIRWGIDERGDMYRWEYAGQTKGRQNTYALPKGATAALELERQGDARIVVLRIQSPDLAGPWLAIEALAGRDERLAVEEEK
jgi:type II secretory pathway pseudopilin PulG